MFSSNLQFIPRISVPTYACWLASTKNVITVVASLERKAEWKAK